MPIVHANVWEGFGQKKAKTVIQGITKVFVDMGIPKHAVEVLVHEIPKSHWGVAGEPASEVLKDEAPPPWRLASQGANPSQPSSWTLANSQAH